jgi:hypothetical protein
MARARPGTGGRVGLGPGDVQRQLTALIPPVRGVGSATGMTPRIRGCQTRR